MSLPYKSEKCITKVLLSFDTFKWIFLPSIALFSYYVTGQKALESSLLGPFMTALCPAAMIFPFIASCCEEDHNFKTRIFKNETWMVQGTAFVHRE